MDEMGEWTNMFTIHHSKWSLIRILSSFTNNNLSLIAKVHTCLLAEVHSMSLIATVHILKMVPTFRTLFQHAFVAWLHCKLKCFFSENQKASSEKWKAFCEEH